MTKKIISVIVAILLIMTAFCSCNTKPNETDDTTKTTSQNINLKSLYDNCVTKMPEMISLDSDMMLDYCGINTEDCVESYVSICADSLKTDEIWLIKATDSEAANRISDLAKSRLQAKSDESITYSPEQYAIVQKAKIITNGEYFALIVSPDVSEIEKIISEAF